jgi:hypothetical protein
VIACVLFLPIPVYLSQQAVNGDVAQIPNYGLDPACEYSGDIFDDRPQCKLPGVPKVALWGDSFAMQWGAGVADALGGKGLIQITKSMCGPVDELAVIRYEYSRRWAAGCIRFNEAALRYIVTSDSIKTVVLSSAFQQYTINAKSYLVGDQVERPNPETLRTRLLETISKLRLAGKRVVVIAPPARLGRNFQIGRKLPTVASDCAEQERARLSITALFFGQKECGVINLLQDIERRDNVDVVWPERVTCDGGNCVARIGNTMLYREDGHLTDEGSVVLARKLNLADKLKSPD